MDDRRSNDDALFDQIHELVTARFFDELTPEQFARLDSLLAEDATARRIYLQYIYETLALPSLVGSDEREAASPADEPVVQAGQLPTIVARPLTPSEPFVGSPLFACMVATAVLAVMLLGAWLYKISIPEPPAVEQSHSIATLDTPLPAIVGRVTGLHECRWGDADAETFRGAPVRIDSKYSLDAGLLEITYSTGARVILEGPCEYVIDSRASGYLGVGKLIARVEAGGGESGNRGVGESGNRENRSGDSTSPAPLFAICTPSAVVTDLGTEFGVIVGKDGDTATHVIEGRVELKVLGDDRPEHQAIRIAAGESVHVERPAKDAENDLAAVARGKADTNLFTVHPGKLTEYVAKKRLEQFHSWQAFSDELRKRDDLADYWDFQRDGKNPLVLHNRAPGGRDGAIEGARWVSGRFPGKHALQFSYPSHRVRVRLNDKIKGSQQLTIVASVRIDALPNGSHGLISSEIGLVPGILYWQILDDGRASFAWGLYEQFLATSAEPAVDMSSDIGQWIFLAVTCDLATKKVAFLCDGEQINEATIDVPDSAKEFTNLACTIGDCFTRSAPLEYKSYKYDYNFVGCIGELMIFRKAFSLGELLRLLRDSAPMADNKSPNQPELTP